MMRRYLVITTVVIATALGVLPALASGPGVGGRRVRLDNEPAGPFLIRAVTSPTPPTVENFNVEVKVVEAATGNEVLDAIVIISADPVELEADRLQSVATHEFAPLPTEYAAHLAIPEVGLWLVSIRVDGEAGSGQVSFYQQISNPPDLGVFISVGAPLGGLSLLALVFFWLQKKSKSSLQPLRSVDHTDTK